MMGTVVSIVIDALAFGGVYALLAAGFSVILRASRVAQFGAGYVALAGGVAISHLTGGLPEWVALVLTLPIGAVIGVILFFVVGKVGEFFGASETSLSIAALACGLLIGSIIDKATASSVQSAPLFIGGYFNVGGQAVEWNELFTIGAAFVVLIAAYFLVSRTMLGKAMTAVCRAPSVAAVSGLRIDVIVCAAWAIGTALMCYAGGVLTPEFPMSSDVVLTLALKGFAGAIIGGVDRPANAAAGALILAVADTLFVRYVSGGLEDLFVFSLVFLLLILRPQGLFGTQQVRYA
jgi:branched-chain amino acid transport system permease protein